MSDAVHLWSVFAGGNPRPEGRLSGSGGVCRTQALGPPGGERQAGRRPAWVNVGANGGILVSTDQTEHCEVLLRLKGEDEKAIFPADFIPPAGFSSFAYLRSLPVDYIKVDGSLVRSIDREPTNKALVQAVVTVAHAGQVGHRRVGGDPGSQGGPRCDGRSVRTGVLPGHARLRRPPWARTAGRQLTRHSPAGGANRADETFGG
ncbi:MAG TPA: EAL domain-containing protein [Symbiobacteriaceae bacterium]|nr:EAL domain-containing protein [Symbiobacteriaceae bacterium]